MLYIQIYSALICHIPDEQFAFLPERDTTLQLLRVIECVTAEFNEQPYTAAIFLPVSKARFGQQDSYASYTQLEHRTPGSFS